MLEIAIIGAGPYGLSAAAHLRALGLPFRIFGRLMDSWLAHMPKGMLLKSDGFASNIYDPKGEFTLERFCSDRQIEYSHTGSPISLDTFTSYGLAFRERIVPEVEEKLVVELDRCPDGFVLCLDDGEIVKTRRVVLAVGITHFEYIPPVLKALPPALLSHSFRHRDLEPFTGRSVAVIGAGASALDLAGLLHEVGAEVQLVARQTSLNFHDRPARIQKRSLWKRIRHPQSGLGPGLRSKLCANAPILFHYLPERLRLEAVRKHLGPSGGWFIKEKVLGKVPLLLGYAPDRAEIENGKVRLHLGAADGTKRDVLTDHIIAATGYRVSLERLTFLRPEVRSKLKAVNGTPVLSSDFESSVPGLYFIGVAAANSFGPVMRFAFGAGFAARRLTQTVKRSLLRNRESYRAPSVVATTK
jgi:cation diffusion facilitator CzcD-associated flavoprotein CzcO